MAHIPVLLKEVIGGLNPKPGETVIDGTAGGGGHAQALCTAIGATGTYLGIDADQSALRRVAEVLKSVPCKVVLARDNFRHIKRAAEAAGLTTADIILLDLGMSSDQLDKSGRGFSFQYDEPLLMTYSETTTPEQLTAREIVNNWDEENIATIIEAYGEERFAKRITSAIAESRRVKPIMTTADLVGVIRSAVPGWYTHRKIHFATKTFQALRIAVNDELGALTQALQDGWELLGRDGRLAVITFHSLEGRICKQFFAGKVKSEQGKLIFKKPVLPSREEVLANPRARSAQLRIIQNVTHAEKR